jgi:hypothetical protein
MLGLWVCACVGVRVYMYMYVPPACVYSCACMCASFGAGVLWVPTCPPTCAMCVHMQGLVNSQQAQDPHTFCCLFKCICLDVTPIQSLIAKSLTQACYHLRLNDQSFDELDIPEHCLRRQPASDVITSAVLHCTARRISACRQHSLRRAFPVSSK